MQLISKFNLGFRFLLCVIDFYIKYAWVVPLKNIRITITNGFQKILDESNPKLNKIWVYEGSELYHRSMKSWYIGIYSIHNEGKFVVTKKFIRTLKNQICKYITSISKNVYIDKLAGIVNEYNKTYHNKSQMKPVVVKSSRYINFGIENIEKDRIFEVGEHVRHFCKRLHSKLV